MRRSNRLLRRRFVCRWITGARHRPAHAAPTDDYINAVHIDGIKSSENDSDLLIAGRGICQMLDDGATRSEVFHTVYEATKLPADLSRTFINDAVQYLCPWNG